MQGLTDILAQDVTAWGDGGGKAVAARRPKPWQRAANAYVAFQV